MSNIKQELSFLILGQQGGENRIKILEHLKERSYNLNQLANTLDLNYRTIKHHIDKMLDYDLIVSSGEGYGKVYFLSPKLEDNYETLEDMKKKLETVTKSPEIYEKIRKHTNDGLILLDEYKDVIYLNERAGEITEFKDEYLIGKNIEELLESDIHQDLEQEVLTKDEFVEKEINITTKSGKNKTIVITMDYFYFDGEENKGFSLLISDITKETKQRDILNALMSHSEVMLAYLDPDFNLVYVNSAYAQRTDHSPEKLVGKNHFELFPNGENKNIFQEVLDKGEKMSVKDRDLLDSGESPKEGLYWSLEPVKDDGEKIKGLVLSSYEISDAR